jgi:hypothetical protein
MMVKPGLPPLAARQRRFRSPTYPFVALGKAVERASSLHETIGQDEVGLDVLAAAWGYGIKSSGLVQSASALIQYGLLTDRGSRDARKFQLTPEAIRLVGDPGLGSTGRSDALRRMALRPKVFAELARQFGGRDVSDDDLKEHLTRGRVEAGGAPFSSEAAEEVVARFRETMAYAGLDLRSVPEVGDKKDPALSLMRDSLPHLYRGLAGDGQPAAITLALPQDGERVFQEGILSGTTSYRIIVRGHLGAKELDRLMAKLQFDREILAEAEEVDNGGAGVSP